MKNLMKKILIIPIIFAPLLLSSCMTSRLFEDRSHIEEVSSVLVSADGKNIVAITEKYHYIFNSPDILTRTLKSSIHHTVKAEIHTFKVDANGHASGRIDLTMDSNSTSDELSKAVSYGFTNSENSAYAIVHLKGMRYEKNNIDPQFEIQKLHKPYYVAVTEPQTSGEKAVKTLITPITLAVDGVLVIGSMPFVMLGYGTLLR